MKPCPHNRQTIAALVLGHLDTENATALRAHLESCAGCREYLEDLTQLTATMKNAEPDAGLPATAAFHQRVIAAVKGEQSKPVPAYALARLLSWRIALPAAVGVVLAALLLSQLQPHTSPPVRPVPQPTASPLADATLAPTIANYNAVANQSLDRFDQLLTEQGKKNLPRAPLYTASTVTLATKTD